MKALLGAHTSIQGGVSTSVGRAVELGFNVMQIFTKNNNQWKGKKITGEEAESFRRQYEESQLKFVVSHDSYLINLCSANKETLKKSRAGFIEEITNCNLLGIPHLNFHPGAHGGQGEDKGIKMIAESINYAHDKTPDAGVSSMIETTAGQGTNLGYTFEQIAEIIERVEDKDRMTVCIDTAHIWAAGYDIKDHKKFLKVMRDFDSIIGLDRLKCFHINDSKKPLGSKIDRHEHVGKGFIGKEGFSNIMNDRRLKKVPKVLETPKGKDQKEDIENINTLLSLLK